MRTLTDLARRTAPTAALAVLVSLTVLAFPAEAKHPTPGDTCTAGNPRYTKHKPRWREKFYRYSVNKDTLPGKNTKSYARIVDGHRTWKNTLDDCHYKSKGTWGSVAEGDTDRHSMVKRDKRNTWDFGKGPKLSTYCPSGVIACTRWFISRKLSGNWVFNEADVRFDNRQTWTNNYIFKPNTGIDIWAVAAHEVGHVLGLAHHPSEYMTMHASMFGERPRTLGKADVLGMRRLYGG